MLGQTARGECKWRANVNYLEGKKHDYRGQIFDSDNLFIKVVKIYVCIILCNCYKLFEDVAYLWFCGN